jgi:phage tail tape-measure protein
MGVNAQKYQDFNNADFGGQVKLVGQELKSLAAPVVDKAKQGIQNMVSKVKTKLQR